MIRGLDVSSCQGVIKWKLVPDDFRFIIVKVSEGVLGLDPMRRLNIEGAMASGHVVGVYHFFRSSMDPVGQAERLWQALGDTMPSFVALDFETIADGISPTEAVNRLLRCVEAVEKRFGRSPLVYTYPWFAKSMGSALTVATELARCPLWMADYSGGESPPDGWHPYIPEPWTDWTMAQTSGNNSSRVPGIVGAVDHNVFNGGEKALRTLQGLPDQDAIPTEPALPVPANPYDDDPEAA